jgi:hypothetical protein
MGMNHQFARKEVARCIPWMFSVWNDLIIWAPPFVTSMSRFNNAGSIGLGLRLVSFELLFTRAHTGAM